MSRQPPEPRLRALGPWWRLLLASEPHRGLLVWPFLVALAVALAGAGFETDPYWGARAGWENLTGTPLARPDTWSWSATGTWYPNSPAWNMVLGAAWHFLGYGGLLLAGVTSICAYFAVAWALARRLGARWLPGMIGMAVPAFLAIPLLSTRATLVAQSLLLGSLLFAHYWSTRAARHSLPTNLMVTAAAGFAFSLAGNWIHLSFLATAPVIAASWAFVWVLTPGLLRLTRLLTTLSGTAGLLVGCIFSPFGIPITIQRSIAVRDAVGGLYVEWQSVLTAPGVARQLTGVFVAVLLALTGSRTLRAARVGPTGKPDPRLLVPMWSVSLVALVAGIDAVRFAGIALLTCIPVSAAYATWSADSLRTAGSHSSVPGMFEPYLSSRFWGHVFVIAGAVIVPSLATAGLIGGAKHPESAITMEIPTGCRLLTDAATAATVLLLRDDVTVWIDGRADFYGRDHLLRSRRILQGVESIPADAQCALFATGTGDRQPIVAKLDGDPQWSVVAQVDGYALWFRR